MTYRDGSTIWMTLNWHKGGSNNRTNLYVIKSDDFGTNWTDTEGKAVKTPMNFQTEDGLILNMEKDKNILSSMT